MAATICAYADHVEVMADDRKVAHHAQVPEERTPLPSGKAS
jgi:hypothetical protein